MDSISVQVCAYWVAGKIIDMAVEKKLSTIRAVPRRAIDVAGAYVVAAGTVHQRRRSTFGTSRHADEAVLLDSATMQIQVHQRRRRSVPCYCYRARGTETTNLLLATVLNTSQIEIYE